MSRYEVETDLIVHVKIKLVVEADSKAEAINAAADLLPTNSDMARAQGWKATVALKPPKGVEITSAKPYHFEQASGADKAKQLRS
jgi:hypothetical protein